MLGTDDDRVGETVAAVPLAHAGQPARVERKAVIDPIAARCRELRRTPDKPV